MRGALFLVVVATACSDDGRIHRLPDAPPLPIDAPDAAVQPVTIKITIDGVGQQNVQVFFQRADSSLAAMKLTDAAGEASEYVDAGGFVTALDAFIQPPPPALGAPSNRLHTFAGVKPGDRLVLAEPVGGDLANVTFLVPDDPDKNALSYYLYTSCGEDNLGGGGGSGDLAAATVSLFGCTGGTADVVVESRDEGGAAVNALFRAGVAIADGGTVDLLAGSYQPATTATFDYTDVPAGIDSLVIDAFLFTAKGRLVHQVIGTTATGGVASASSRRPVIPMSTAVTQTGFFTSGMTRHQVLEWGPPGPYTLAANVLLPSYTSFPELNVATRTTTWSTSPGASQPDFVVMTQRFSRGEPQPLFWTWHIVAPYTGASVTFPQLAGDAATFNPMANDIASTDDLHTAKVPGGYDAVRAHVLSLQSVHDLVVGGAGRAVLADLQFGKAAR